MKKNIKLLLSSLLLFIFTNCQNDDENIPNENSIENSLSLPFGQNQFIGKISKIGVTNWGYGTHLLKITPPNNVKIPKDKSEIVLSSKKIELDKYIGQEVTIKAIYLHGSISGGPAHYEVIEIKPVKNKIITGILTRNENSLWQYGTHLLSFESKGMTALSSKTINLDKYIGQQVEVTAIYLHGSISGGPAHYKVIAIKVVPMEGLIHSMRKGPSIR